MNVLGILKKICANQSRKCARKYDSKRVKAMHQEDKDGIIVLRNGQSLECCTYENHSNASYEPPVAGNQSGKA
jgi:hypothetical protein